MNGQAMVETMGLCSNPSAHPAFDRLLRILSEDADFLAENMAVTWEKSVSTRKKQQQHRLEPEEVDELVSAYTTGELINDLAERFSIHRTTVIEHARKHGLKLRNKNRNTAAH